MSKTNKQTGDLLGLFNDTRKLEECSELSKKLIEMEYVYAKESALLTINQRGSMMRVYLAIVAIIAAGAFALLRDEHIDGLDLPLLAVLSTTLLSVSIYYASGLKVLRSDWYDYIKAMSHLKIYILNSEDYKQRKFLLECALMHHPDCLPNRNLKTNFFFYSFSICVFISALSSCFIIALLANHLGYQISDFIDRDKIPSVVISIGIILFPVSYLIASATWKKLLE